MATITLNVSLLLLLPTFGHSEVPSSPSRYIFSIIPSYLCPVSRGIVTVSAANRTALRAMFARKRSPRAPVHLFSLLAERV